MAQQFRSSSEGPGHHAPVHFTALALKSLGQVYDMNLSAARVLLQTQARAASAVGLPDWSGLFDTVDQRARRVFSAGAEQLVNSTQRANEVAAELQREVGRVVETQTATVAQTIQQGFEELGSQTSEGLNQLVQTAREQAEEAERVASSIGEQMRDTMREGGQQARNEMRRGQENMTQAMDRIGEKAEEATEEARPAEDKDKSHRRGRLAA